MLKRLSTLIALFVFLFSIIAPYYHWIGGLEISEQTYWSYKADYLSYGLVLPNRRASQSWFLDYWFGNQGLLEGLGITWVPLTMFVIQALTLAFGCLSLANKRRIIQPIPFCLSLTVLALMCYVGYRLIGTLYVGGGYQLGYYLVYPSVVLFAFAFALAEVGAIDLGSMFR